MYFLTSTATCLALKTRRICLRWLRRSAINRLYRSEPQKVVSGRSFNDADLDPASWEPPDVLAYAQVQREVAQLPAEQRAIIILRYGEGMMAAEIAEALELPANTVKSRLHRALTALRSKLDVTRVQLT